MVKILMHGCNGHMGQVIARLAASDSETEIIAGVDVSDHITNPYPVFKSLEDYMQAWEKDESLKADVVIDFSSAAAADKLLDYCGAVQMPVVLCTTGLTPEQLERVKTVAGKTAVLKSANMSMGINLLLKLLKEAAGVLAPAGFDIEIVEKQHNQKVDAPSGTALALADSINEEFNNEYTYVYDRSTRRQKRDAKEIGLSAVRGGTIVGDHDVIFAGEDEVITFSHTAYSKNVFAKGAVHAAKFLKAKPAGLYDMSDVIEGA